MFYNREREHIDKEMDIYYKLYMMFHIHVREIMFPSCSLQQFSDIVPLKLSLQTAEEAFLIVNKR